MPPVLVTPAKRLLLYLLGTVAVFAVLEAGIRSRSALFAAASHRTLTKLELLKQHGRVDLLFFGSSRTQDGVSPRLISEELGEANQLRGFNVASTATSLETLDWLSLQVADRPGLRTVVLEVSGPQLTKAAPQFLSAREPPGDLEGRLTAEVRDHLALVEHRGVLFSDNLTRLPALLIFGPSLDGSEVMAGEQLSSWLGHAEPKAPPFDEAAWKLRDLDGVTAASALPVDLLATLADRFSQRGVRVVFMVPPLAQSYADAPERGAPMIDLLGQLRARTRAEIWDWSAASLPDEIFRGSSHLNHLGRAQFARVLAKQLVRSGLAGGGR
jgi:hypothetical protein